MTETSKLLSHRDCSTIRAVLTFKRLKYFSTGTLLAFLLNATLPFFVPAAANAALISGQKELLCTVRGYERVDLQSTPTNNNVIVIQSPLAESVPNTARQQNSDHPSQHCSLCFINSQSVTPALLSTSALPPSHNDTRSTFFSIIENHILKQQHVTRLAPARAPPLLT